MKCAYPEERLALHIEGDLSPRQARGVERHLNACPECRRTATELRAGLAAFKALARPTFDSADFEDVRQRVSKGFRDLETSPGRTLRLERAVLAGLRGPYATAGAAAVAVLAVLTLVISRPSEKERILPPTAVASVVVSGAASMNLPPVTPRDSASANLAPVPIPARPRAIEPSPAPMAGEATSTPPAPAFVADERPAEPQEPLLVKLFTDDPNVVIYWLVEPQGGADATSSF